MSNISLIIKTRIGYYLVQLGLYYKGFILSKLIENQYHFDSALQPNF